MATISLQGVKKAFGKTDVIHGIDADVNDGEFIVIVGPSGCGKSTLLRMVAGLETISSGDICINEKRVNDLEPMERDIAMVFQNYALYPHMSVFDNMAYGLKIAKVPKEEINQRVNTAAEILQLQDYLKRKPRELSGGQRQRVAMGRAIVRKPAVFLFDEPLSNLDAKLRVQMRLEIKSLQRELGVTSLYVTHDQVEAMTLADRMIVMNGGQADQIGAPLEVYNNPQSKFVAGFIGSPPMNFLNNFIHPDSAATSDAEKLALDKFKADLPADIISALQQRSNETRDITIGVRPEHISLCDTAQAHLVGKLRYTEPLGAETLLYLEVQNKELITLRQPGDAAIPSPGDDCAIRLETQRLCLFDHNDKRIKV